KRQSHSKLEETEPSLPEGTEPLLGRRDRALPARRDRALPARRDRELPTTKDRSLPARRDRRRGIEKSIVSLVCAPYGSALSDIPSEMPGIFSSKGSSRCKQSLQGWILM
ncbi:hypothetical protein NDU88_011522, partial [Pleurodeles waltl]